MYALDVNQMSKLILCPLHSGHQSFVTGL